MEDRDLQLVIAKVQKLLALADNNPNENEASLAAEKAQALLEAYNLDMAQIHKKSKTFAKRDDKRRGGGLYKWQRNLWHAVGVLNFCQYYYYKGNIPGTSYEHRLIGSQANVIGAELMGQYLEDTIERLAQQWVRMNRPGKSVFIREAIAYREGMASRITNRLWSKRWEHLAEEKERIKREREANLRRGINTENALVLQDVINTEEDLNNDYLHDWEPGTSAKQRVENEARQAAAKSAADELLRRQEEWDKLHPEEATARKKREQAKVDEYWHKELTKKSTRKETAEEQRRRLGSYKEGWQDGENISLDKQIDRNKTGLIR